MLLAGFTDPVSHGDCTLLVEKYVERASDGQVTVKVLLLNQRLGSVDLFAMECNRLSSNLRTVGLQNALTGWRRDLAVPPYSCRLSSVQRSQAT